MKHVRLIEESVKCNKIMCKIRFSPYSQLGLTNLLLEYKCIKEQFHGQQNEELKYKLWNFNNQSVISFV